MNGALDTTDYNSTSCIILMTCSHCSAFAKTGEKNIRFLTRFELLLTKTHKTEVFENALDQCERTKMGKNKNAVIATIQNTYSMAPTRKDIYCFLRSYEQCDHTKTDIFIFILKRNGAVSTGDRHLQKRISLKTGHMYEQNVTVFSVLGSLHLNK